MDFNLKQSLSMKSFVVAGAVATLSMFTNNLVLSPEKELKDTISQVQQKEGLNDVQVNAQNTYSQVSSSASLKLGKENSKKAEIYQSPYTTFITKIFAPIEFAKTNSALYSKFVALHELAHTELNHILYNNPKPFDVKLEGVPENVNRGISNHIASGFLSNKKSLLYANYHENFADAYGAILIIKNLSPEYSDKEIYQVIKSRHALSHNQSNMLWGGMGDNDHKTEHSLKKILDTPMDKIRAMSKEESQAFAIQVASTSTVEQFPDIYAQLFQGLSNAIPEENKKAFSNLKLDTSFMNKLTELQDKTVSENTTPSSKPFSPT